MKLCFLKGASEKDLSLDVVPTEVKSGVLSPHEHRGMMTVQTSCVSRMSTYKLGLYVFYAND